MDMQENPFKNNYPVFKKHFTFHTIKNIFFFFFCFAYHFPKLPVRYQNLEITSILIQAKYI